MAARILVGTCNWSDHGSFYPQGLPAQQRLAYYARYFPLVEIDSSYYGVPSPERCQRWAEMTPEAFRFNIKAYRSLTYHEREQGRPREPTEREEEDFLRCLEPLQLSGKLKAVHYQFPPWFLPTPENRDRLARIRERHPDQLLVVEFRNRAWAEPERLPELLGLLQEASLSLCVVDEPQVGSGSFPALEAVTDPRLTMVRFHGRNRGAWYRQGKSSADRFDYLYLEEELRELVPRVRRLAEGTQELHLLFNNNRSNYAVVNGLQLAELLDLEGVPPRSQWPRPAVPEPTLPLGPVQESP